MKLHDGFGINKHMTYVFHNTVTNYTHFLKIQVSLEKLTVINLIKF